MGFSVTAEAGGYVERCASLCKKSYPNYDVTKVGLGGLEPDHARHLASGIVDTYKPDALIIEMATSAYRDQPESQQLVADHFGSMEALLAICKDRNMACGILDLPKTGIIGDRDWTVETNAELSRRCSIPHSVVPLNQELLRDKVHPTEEGKNFYATALYELVDAVFHAKPDFSDLAPVRSFDAYAMKNINITGADYGNFSRAGFDEKMLLISEGETVEIPLPEKVMVTGLIMRMGPKSGTFLIHRDGVEGVMNCYDRHCYYTRIGGKSLKPVVTDQVSVFQSSTLPLEELLKGDKDNGPRIGGITHILYENSILDS